MDTGRHVIDELPAYSLGILAEEEQRQVDRHLAECSVCQAELRELQAVVNFLPASVELRPPPDRVRAGLLRQIGVETAGREAAPRPGWRQRLSGLFRGLSPAWGLAGLALLLILVVSNLVLFRQLQQNREENRQLAFQVIDMSGEDAAGEARGVLVISPDGRYGTLVVDGLEPLTQDQAYQLWLNSGSERDSGGVFSVGPTGYGALKISSPRPLNEYSTFGVTVEPAAGSPEPTGARVLAGEL